MRFSLAARKPRGGQAVVELLLLAGQLDAAFAAAAQHGIVAVFAGCLGNSGAPSDYERAAAALEAVGEWAAAGGVRERRGQAKEAVALYIKVRPHSVPCR